MRFFAGNPLKTRGSDPGPAPDKKGGLRKIHNPPFAFNHPEGRFRLTGYRIALTARESTPPNPMITVSSNNQTIGVILDFMRHLLIGFVCRQTDMNTVYKAAAKCNLPPCSR